MNKTHKIIIFSSALVIGIWLLVIQLGLAWTNPTATPPAGNPPPPIHLQGATPGTVQTGNINISGTGLFGGNIGIGTTAPISLLQVAGTATIGTGGAAAGAIGNVQITGSPGSPVSGRLTFGTDGTGWQFRIAQNQGGTITDRVTVVTGGNVGIGTTAPGQRLDVAGGGIRVQDFTTAGGQNLVVGDDTFFSDIDVADTLSLRGIQNSAVATLELGSGGARISGSGGNVGIGTTAPAHRLHVVGNAQITGNLTVTATLIIPVK